MHTDRFYTFLAGAILLLSIPAGLFAQTEVEQERSSLRGLNGVGFTVNIEQNTVFADTQLVNIETIREQSTKELKKGNIGVFDDEAVKESTRTPVLYMHINCLSTRTGIVSFAITISLYQPVKLVLNRDSETTASTWESSTVGIATYDKIGVIKQAALKMVQNFIADYHLVNSN